MGQKTNPIGFRLAVRRNWQSRWFATKKDFGKLLAEDQLIRSKLMEKLKQRRRRSARKPPAAILSRRSCAASTACRNPHERDDRRTAIRRYNYLAK